MKGGCRRNSSQQYLKELWFNVCTVTSIPRIEWKKWPPYVYMDYCGGSMLRTMRYMLWHTCMEQLNRLCLPVGVAPNLSRFSPDPSPRRVLCSKGMKYNIIRVHTYVAVYMSLLWTHCCQNPIFCPQPSISACSCCCVMKCCSSNCNKTLTVFNIPACKSWLVVCARTWYIYTDRLWTVNYLVQRKWSLV